MKNFYQILGLKQDVPKNDIKKAYRKLSLKYHPDVNGDDTYFEDLFKDIQEA